MMHVRGMYGMGDCIHQRAPLRELLDRGEPIVLDTFYYAMYHDLVRRGLRLRRISSHAPRIRDDSQTQMLRATGNGIRVTYNRDMIQRCGTILGAQYECLGMTMPERPDFSLPIPTEWRVAARRRLQSSIKPLMVYRPSVLNNLWRSEARSPDPVSYGALFSSVRDRFHVVAVANLGDHGERVIGDMPRCDQYFVNGELGFEELAGLFAEAQVAFTCPGFAPVLSQAVGTPTVIVYGGNESFRTTNSVGAHLAPTLAIEPVHPCECHMKDHDCDKRIDVPVALERLEKFLCAL